MAFITENMSSQLDGVTKTFSPARSYFTSSLMVVVNGLFFTPGTDFTTDSPQSFTLTGNVDAPESGESMLAIYEPQASTTTSSGGGGSPGDVLTIGLPGGGQLRLYF